jgi:putative tricarboxylic transport membrane protein
MEDIFANLLLGFGVALQPWHLLLITTGGVLGTIIGMRPLPWAPPRR